MAIIFVVFGSDRLDIDRSKYRTRIPSSYFENGYFENGYFEPL
jgi:hypothetical protein